MLIKTLLALETSSAKFTENTNTGNSSARPALYVTAKEAFCEAILCVLHLVAVRYFTICTEASQLIIA
jgi:hypothetical protein